MGGRSNKPVHTPLDGVGWSYWNAADGHRKLIMNSNASAFVSFAIFIGTLSYLTSNDFNGSGLAAILMVLGAFLLIFAIGATSKD